MNEEYKSKIKWLGGVGFFGISSTSAVLVTTHKYIVPLDSSKEVMGGAIGLSGLLYLASFCALGYALYRLCQKNTQIDPQNSSTPAIFNVVSLPDRPGISISENPGIATNTQESKNTILQNQSNMDPLKDIIMGFLPIGD